MIKYESNAIDQNCLQCAIAGLLDLPLSDVPTVHEWTKNLSYWFDGLDSWCNERGITVVSVVDDSLLGQYHIFVATGDESGHAVIAKGAEVIWDSSPMGKIKELPSEGYSILLIKDCAIQKKARESEG